MTMDAILALRATLSDKARTARRQAAAAEERERILWALEGLLGERRLLAPSRAFADTVVKALARHDIPGTVRVDTHAVYGYTLTWVPPAETPARQASA